jgi:hypothetical protein
MLTAMILSTFVIYDNTEAASVVLDGGGSIIGIDSLEVGTVFYDVNFIYDSYDNIYSAGSDFPSDSASARDAIQGFVPTHIKAPPSTTERTFISIPDVVDPDAETEPYVHTNYTFNFFLDGGNPPSPDPPSLW